MSEPSRSEQDLNTILCWAAGADRDVSGIPSVDADRLLLLLSRHKLQVRCAARAKAERPPWYTRALSIALWQTARVVRAQVQQRIDALCEMTAALPHPDGPPIPIKGFTAYALTGDENTIRPSGDLDIFFPDWDQAKAILLELGYVDLNVPREQGTWWVHHEIAKIARGGLLVEVHDFFPVFGYPGVDISDPTAGRPGWFTQTVYKIWVASRIYYADLRGNAVPVRTAAGGDYWVAAPHMAALVLCAHIFRDYVEECAYQLTAPVPLAEVADLHDIARLPGFDPAQFLALTERCKAQHSVALAGQMLNACFGTNDLPVPVPTPEYYAKRVFPQCINRYKGSWAVLSSLEEMPTRSMDMVLAGLGGANTLQVGDSFSVIHAAGGPSAPVAVHDSDGQVLPLRFSLAWTDDALCFALHLSPVPASEEDFVMVNFGGAADGCWRCRGTEDTLVHHRGALRGDAAITVHQDGYTLHLSLPWPQIGGTAQSDGEILLLLTVNRLPSSTLVPLCLIRE